MTTAQVDEKILGRLAKLMEMAERGTENEAQVAAQRAAELMARHQIAAATINAILEQNRRGDAKVNVERGRVDADDGATTSRVENWHKQLANEIADAFGARMWMRGRGKQYEFFIVGPPDSVSTVRYMYLQLSKDVHRLARAAMREHGETQNAWRRTYCLGMVQRLGERLRAGRRAAMQGVESTALVWVDKQKQAVDVAYSEMQLRKAKRGTSQRPDARGVGYRDGDKVQLGDAGSARLGADNKKLTGGQS